MATSMIKASSSLKSPLSHGSCSWPCKHQLSSLSMPTSKSATLHRKLFVRSLALHHRSGHGKEGSEQVTEGIQKSLLSTSSDPAAKLRMIDNIQRLGLSHHFEEEINALLGEFSDWDAGQDLFATALQFRLMRHNGWPAASDVFQKYLDTKKNFEEQLAKDTHGMLSLYEASYLGAEDEGILLQAMDFTRSHLYRSIPNLGPDLHTQVTNALRLPRHLRMSRLESRNYIEEYSHASDHIPALSELAKLDYDEVQSLHRRELAEICRWWKGLGLVDKLGFARDRPTECFLWTVGILPERKDSFCRIELAKTICILLVLDDVYDTYGTLGDLVLFNEAITRWDLDAMEKLPEYMKICYMALYNTTNEIAYKIQKEHGWTVVAHLKRTWIDIFEAFLAEAKWFNSRYTPNFREYLDNGVTSSGTYMALVHSFFLVGNGVSEETISMMRPYPRLFACSGEILRLWDDLGTSREEEERGDVACSIQCHMRESNNPDEEEARKHIRQLIGKLWLELNGLAMAPTSLPPSVAKASMNAARTAQVIYQHGDDGSSYSVDDNVQRLLFRSFASEDTVPNAVLSVL